MKHIKTILILLFMAANFISFLSCKNDDNTKIEFDPERELLLTRFFPDSGGVKTSIILEGSNFGTDTSMIHVFFNKKRASVVKAKGDKMYALVPRLPGDTCTITVKIGDKTAIYNHEFRYKTQLNVSTIAGIRGNIDNFTGGPLNTVTFGAINGLVVDDVGNIFISMGSGNPRGLCRVNEKENMATWISSDVPNKNQFRAPTIDPRTQIIYVPTDGGQTFVELNPISQWMPRVREIISYEPTPEEIEAGDKKLILNYKHCFAFCPWDNQIYSRSWGGIIGKFDPQTRIGRHVLDDLQPEVESYLAFDPLEPHMMYLSFQHRQCIYKMDVSKPIQERALELYAGGINISGWRDGKRLDAEFNNPKQLAFDSKGILYVSDHNNHCIRQITRDGIVSTACGIPGRWGTTNGSPEEAQFDNPYGIAIDKDDNIIIGEDHGNRMLRKLTLE